MTTVVATRQERDAQRAAREALQIEDCPSCERPTALGLIHTGAAVRVDAETVSLNGEIVAMLEGRMTYARFGYNLAPRVAGRGVREAPAGGLYVLHVCALPSLGREVFRVGGGGA